MDLENFIKNNRDEFDDEMPNTKVWDNINNRLADEKKSNIISLFPVRKFAAACLLLLTGGLVGFYLSNNINSNSHQQINAEFVEAESFYKKQYQKKVAQLTNYSVESEFSEDLQQFEAIIDELKIDLTQVPKGNRERVITTIIQNYQTKIEALERVLEQLESIDSGHQNSKKNEVII